jgi:hypothetical protein
MELRMSYESDTERQVLDEVVQALEASADESVAVVIGLTEQGEQKLVESGEVNRVLPALDGSDDIKAAESFVTATVNRRFLRTIEGNRYVSSVWLQRPPASEWDERQLFDLNHRVQDIMRQRPRRQPASHELAGPEGIVVDLRAHQARVRDQELQLTEKEFALLQLLLEWRGEALEADAIATAIWGGPASSRCLLETYVSRLRKKLGPARGAIKTVRGFGYMIS